MNVLAITYAFVPLRFPATFRLLKWCKGLSEQGHSITIVAVHPDTFVGPKQPSLQDLVPPGVRHVQVRSPENNLAYRAMRKRPSWFYPFLQPHKMEWRKAAMQSVLGLDLGSYDVLYSCSQPPVCHLVGYEIACRTALPWVAFFSDPWVGSPWRSRARHARTDAHNAKNEEKVMHRADLLVFPSREFALQVVARYGPELEAKVRVLPHCFVPEWYNLTSVLDPARTDTIRLLCAGNFYSNRTPEPLFGALRALQHGKAASRLSIELVGVMTAEYREEMKHGDLAQIASHRGEVGYLESLALMKRADYLLLVDGPLGEAVESMFLPSKLIDYLGAGRPVLGLTPLAGTSSRVLLETGNAVCDICDPSSLTRALEGIAEGSFRVSPDKTAIARYAYKQVTRELEGILYETRARSSLVR